MADLGNDKIPFKELRECLKLHPERLKPIFDEKNKETQNYRNAIEDLTQIEVDDTINYYSSRNSFTSWLVKTVPLDAETGLVKTNPKQFNPCAGIVYQRDRTFLPSGKAFDQSVITASYLCSKAPTEEQKLQESIESLAQLKKTYLSDYYRFAGELSDDVDVTKRKFSEDTEERFADALGMRVFAKMISEKYAEGSSSDWQEKRRNLFFSSRASFCDPASLASEHPEMARVEKSYSYENHSSNEQRRKDFMNSPMREVLGCKKDTSNKECK